MSVSRLSVRFILVAALLVTGGTARAADAAWTLLPKNSALEFTATYSGQELTGGFGSFGGTIHFDPNQLDAARIDLDIDMTSIESPDEEVARTLATEPWFAVPKFPGARFVSSHIRVDDTPGAKEGTAPTYIAEGSLTLRGVSAPVSVRFHFESYGPKPGSPDLLRAVAKGEARVNRTAFGVGQGQWASTSTVADGVKVTFTLAAERSAGP